MAEHQVVSFQTTVTTVTHATSCRTSGKEALLPAPPPLRTVRAPFEAHGSSLSERPPWFRGTQHELTSFMAFTILVPEDARYGKLVSTCDGIISSHRSSGSRQ